MAELLALADDDAVDVGGPAAWLTESTGHPLLRAEIARLHEGLSADDVMVFAGAEEAIFCLMSTGLDSGDHVVVTWPGYQSLYEVARASGAKVGLHLLREEDGWGLDVDWLLRSLHTETRMVVVNAPHQPTGMLPTEEEGGASPPSAAPAGSASWATRSTASSNSTARRRCPPRRTSAIETSPSA